MSKIPAFGRSGLPIAGGLPSKPASSGKAEGAGEGDLGQPKHPKGKERAGTPRYEPGHHSQRNPAHQRKSSP